MLLPLDEVPVHVHRFAARAPCDSKGSGCPGVSVESIQPRPPRPAKPEDRKGGGGKADANLTIFLSTCRTDRPRRGMALSCFLSVAFGFEATGELGELEARNGARPSNCSLSDLLFPFFSALRHPNSPPRPGEAPHPAPSARKSATRTAQKTALCAPCERPGGFGIRKSASN